MPSKKILSGLKPGLDSLTCTGTFHGGKVSRRRDTRPRSAATLRGLESRENGSVSAAVFDHISDDDIDPVNGAGTTDARVAAAHDQFSIAHGVDRALFGSQLEVEVGESLAPPVTDVVVGLDQPRQEGLALEVDDVEIRPLVRTLLLRLGNSCDPFTLDDDRGVRDRVHCRASISFAWVKVRPFFVVGEIMVWNLHPSFQHKMRTNTILRSSVQTSGELLCRPSRRSPSHRSTRLFCPYTPC